MITIAHNITWPGSSSGLFNILYATQEVEGQIFERYINLLYKSDYIWVSLKLHLQNAKKKNWTTANVMVSTSM